jgi:prepilin-type N-terminal cleavage/methylation domain-containing protein
MKKRGFTMVEMVMVIAILGILVGTLSPWLIESAQSFNLISNRKSMLGQMRAGFDRMVAEIRLIPGQSQIIATSANSFQFQYPTGTSITYSLSGGNLMRNSDILMNNVTALSFTYYDQAGSATTTPASVRSVMMSLTATAPNTSSSLTVQTRLFLRNTGNYYANFTSP